jgi:hypothetical protein
LRQISEFKEGKVMEHGFKEGQLIVCANGDRYEIGKIKRFTDDGAFVWYHSGETAAKTQFEDMHPLVNEYCVSETILGGEDAANRGRVNSIFESALKPYTPEY